MTEDILTPEMLQQLRPELVSEGLLHLLWEDAPTRTILCAGAGAFEAAHITMTRGILAGDADEVAVRFAEVIERERALVPESGMKHASVELAKITRAMGRDIGRAASRDRVGTSGSCPGVAGSY